MIERYSDHAANERTFLAWVRTAIAIMAFGFLVQKFDLFLRIANRSFDARSRRRAWMTTGGKRCRRIGDRSHARSLPRTSPIQQAVFLTMPPRAFNYTDRGSHYFLRQENGGKVDSCRADRRVFR
jgi:hypothetical protein